MDNKLSELSKPIGYFIEWQDEETGEKEWCECSKQNGAPLYSQEYVSALLAELEAKDERIKWLESISTDYISKFQKAQECIAELEAQVKVWESAATKHLERAEEAEKRLATPVRLPETYSPEPWMGPDPSGTWLEKEDVKDSIRAAGFTVQGDE